VTRPNLIARILQRTLVVLAFAAVPVAVAATIDHVAYAQGRAQAVEDTAGALASSRAWATPHAVIGVVSVDDPTSTLFDLMTFARTGKGRLAFGAGIVLLVWGLRGYVFKRVAWMQTKLGGYVSGFGTAVLLYIGGGLAAGMELTLNLASDALVAGFAAAGKWEAMVDLSKRIPPAGKQLAATAAIVLLIGSTGMLVATSPGCNSPYINPIVRPIVECSQAQLDQLDQVTVGDVIAKAKELVARGDFSGLEQLAIDHGIQIGGCIASRILNNFMAPAPGVKAPPPELTSAARKTLDEIRAHYGNAVFRTERGDE
jgi:hypothetical protein